MGEKSEVGLVDGFVFGLVWFREPVLGSTAKKMFDHINRGFRPQFTSTASIGS